jgi:quinate dehydrogenase
MSTVQIQQSQQQDTLAALQVETSRWDKHAYLFGQKITHSLSPLLHDVVYRNIGLNWGQTRLDSADMDLFLSLVQHPDFYGMSLSCVFGLG